MENVPKDEKIEKQEEVAFYTPTLADLKEPKPRKNKVYFLPVNVRAEINEMVDNGKGSTVIRRVLETKYPDLDVPVEATIAEYIKDYHSNVLAEEQETEKALFGLEKDLDEVEKELDRVKNNPPGVHVDKVILLEGLAKKCIARIRILEVYQKNLGKKLNPALEGSLIRYIAESRSLVETMYKYTDEAKMEEDIYKMVNAELLKVLVAVRTTVLETCPEKFNTFKERLYRRLSAIKEEGNEPIIESGPSDDGGDNRN